MLIFHVRQTRHHALIFGPLNGIVVEETDTVCTTAAAARMKNLSWCGDLSEG